MASLIRGFVAAAAVVLSVNAAAAQEKIRIGLIYTLSGPPSVLGQQSKNAFELAVKDLGGKMGGKEVELFVADDGLKPEVAIQKVQELLERDKVDIVVGPIFSNMLQAIHKPVMDCRKNPDQHQCRRVVFRRRGLQSQFLCDLLSERPDLRDAWQSGERQRL